MARKYIICVDDEKIVLDSLKVQLKGNLLGNYSFETAENAVDAMEIIDELSEDEEDILLIVSDWLMPGMKGDEFLIKVHQKFPKIKKIMLTGQADEEAIDRAIKKASLFKCLTKPWDNKELIETIQSALNK